MREQIEALLPALAEAMKADYIAWDSNPAHLAHFGTIEFEFGRNFIRIVKTGCGQRMCNGFVALRDVTTKEGSCKAGDLLKSKGWKAPALNFSRGSLFNLNDAILRNNVRWTGIA